MQDLEIVLRILLCLGFGAMLGLETETRTDKTSRTKTEIEKGRLGGLRTYMILSLFGGFAGIMFAQGYPLFAYLMFAVVSLIILSAYVLNVQYRQAFGITSELSILTAVLISFATTAAIVPIQILLVLALILAFILSQKKGADSLVSRLGHGEFEDILKFLIVVFVIWPFLPDRTFFLADIPNALSIATSLGLPSELTNNLALFNPYRLWLYVLLISGINLFGYFVGRLLGANKAQAISSVFGGLVSSTSAVIAFASQAKKKSGIVVQRLAGLALLANASSFLGLFVIAASISGFIAVIGDITIALLMSSLVIALFYLLRPHNLNGIDYNIQYEPFSLKPALKFVLLLSILRIVVQVIDFYFGSAGFVFATAISGFVGLDVATITIGETWALGQISVQVAAVTFLLTNIVNYVAKTFYGRVQSSFEFSKWLGLGLAISALAAVVVYLV